MRCYHEKILALLKHERLKLVVINLLNSCLFLRIQDSSKVKRESYIVFRVIHFWFMMLERMIEKSTKQLFNIGFHDTRNTQISS